MLDVIVGRDEITADYAPGTVETVVQHDGSVLRLRKLAADYDPCDRISSLTYLQQRHAAGRSSPAPLCPSPIAATCTNSSTPSRRRSTASAKQSSAARTRLPASTPPIASSSPFRFFPLNREIFRFAPTTTVFLQIT